MVRAWCVGVTLFLGLSAFAKPGFEPVPSEKPGEKPTGLLAQIVAYDGATNGVLTVDVKNPTGAPIAFSAAGLYFVPVGDPDQSPQRLGAVGGHALQIAPGATVRTKLDVYCIDSHRPSPTSATPFKLAKDRIPAKITQAIHEDAQKATESMGGIAAPAAKSTVQGTVWKNRDRQWVPLQGEGAQEATK